MNIQELLLLFMFVFAVPIDSKELAHSRIYFDQRHCGIFCANLLLKSFGIPGDERDLESLLLRLVPTNDRGANLHDIGCALRTLGLDNCIIKCTPWEMELINRPAIIHLGFTDQSGHYVLLETCDANSVTMIDGASGLRTRWGKGDFLRKFSGYVLMPIPRYDSVWQQALLLSRWSLLGSLIVCGMTRLSMIKSFRQGRMLHDR